MRIKLCLLFFPFIFSVICSNGQILSRQKAYQLLQTLPEDTSRVNALVDYAIYLESDNLDSSTAYYQKALQLSNRLNYYKGKIRYALNYSGVLNLQSKMEESKNLNKWALMLATKSGDSLNMARANNNLANSFLYQMQYDSAFAYFMESADLFDRINAKNQIHILYMNMGVTLDQLNQQENSLQYFRRALAHAYSLKDSNYLPSIMINMASTFSTLHQYDSALFLLEKSVPIAEKNADDFILSSAYLTMGNVNSKLNLPRQAFEYFNKSLLKAQTLGFKDGILSAYSGMARTCFFMESYKDANIYVDKALEFVSSENTSATIQLYKLAADIKAGRKDFVTAFAYLNKYVVLDDSLAGYQTQKIIAEADKKYKTAEKDKELLQKQLKIEETQTHIRKKNFWLLISIIALTLSSVIAFITYRYLKQEQLLHARELTTLEQQKELEKLKAGLEGQQEERKRIAAEMHDDLGSGLTSILFMADGLADNNGNIKNEIPKIAEAARSIMNKMNEIIWSMNAEYDSLEDLISYIRHQSVELLTQVNQAYKFHIPDNIPEINISGIQRRNIHLVVKEALHNIVKHANAQLVEIEFSFSPHLEIRISDDGKGLEHEQKNQFGNGLKNMRRRMENIGGSWNMSHDNENGTNIHVSLTLAV